MANLSKTKAHDAESKLYETMKSAAAYEDSGKLEEWQEEELEALRKSAQSLSGVAMPFTLATAGATGSFFLTLSTVLPIGIGAMFILWASLKTKNHLRRNQLRRKIENVTGWDLTAPFLSGAELDRYTAIVPPEIVIAEMMIAEVNHFPTPKDAKKRLKKVAETVATIETAEEPKAALSGSSEVVASAQDKPADSAVALPAESDERSLFMHLADNPFLCWFILASQRTGKTSSAAAASLTIKRESATEVYYINLSDHGQGNREAFAHADKIAVGNINGGNSNDVAKLIELAIAVVEKFHESNNAILIVDEWVSLATKGRGILDEFWDVLAPKADALTSNGIGCGRSVWAIAPRFQAATMRDDAKIVKNFKPLLLAIAPGQIVEWKNPSNGTTAKLDYNGALVGQAIKNWPESGITEPTAEDTRRWQRDKVSRIFWADGQWSALGQAPAIPKRAAANPDETNAATSVEQRQTVAKLEQDLAAKLTPPVIDLMPICIDKIAANNGYITLAKLRNSLSKSQQAVWDDDFEASLLQDNRVKWEDVPISGGRVSTRLEYSDANANSE